jgi:dUTP pyrophosphatase
MPITVKAARITGAARFDVGLPTQGTPGAAGYDLQNAWDKPVTLQSGERLAFPVGLRFEIPPGYEGQVRPRSGLALNKGVTVLNAPGTIDSDYRGEVRVILINHGREPAVIAPGERIAQLVIAPVTATCFTVDADLGDTERGEGGFGSTGTAGLTPALLTSMLGDVMAHMRAGAAPAPPKTEPASDPAMPDPDKDWPAFTHSVMQRIEAAAAPGGAAGVAAVWDLLALWMGERVFDVVLGGVDKPISRAESCYSSTAARFVNFDLLRDMARSLYLFGGLWAADAPDLDRDDDAVVPDQNRDAHAAAPAGSGALTSNERRHCIDLVVGMQSKLEQLLALLGGAK